MKPSIEQLRRFRGLRGRERDDAYNQLFSNDEELKELVFHIYSLDITSEERYRFLNIPAFHIFCEPYPPKKDKPGQLAVTPFMNFYQSYIYEWQRFSSKRIPFHEWSDLAETGMNLLKLLIEENQLENFKSDSRFRSFFDNFLQRHEELRLKKGYEQLSTWFDD